MCVNAINWAFAQEIPSASKFLLVALADYANKDTGLCFPSQETLAKKCNMSKRSVVNHIKFLNEKGLIEIRQLVNRVNHYILKTETAGAKPALDSANSAQEIANFAPEPLIKPETKSKSFSSYSAVEEKKNEVLTLTPEQQECFDWAASHFSKNGFSWCTATTSIETFINVYDFPNGKLKAQYDAHKKARTPSTVNGLQSEKSLTKKSEVNHATPKQQNQPVNEQELETLRRTEFMKAEFSRNPDAVILEIKQKGFFYKCGQGMFSRAEFEELGLLIKDGSTTDVQKLSIPKSINALTNKFLVNRNAGVRA